MLRVLFVCMGNICRSPTAEGVFRQMLQENRLENKVEVDSAGTHGYHTGDEPDHRAQRAAIRRGYDLSGLRARKITPEDMDNFDLILAMDQNNLEALRLICPPDRLERLGLFMDYSKKFDTDTVPDPYYGLEQGFDRVLDMVEDASIGLLGTITTASVSVDAGRKKTGKKPL